MIEDWTNPNDNINKHLEGNCFVYVQGNEADIKKYFELVRLSKNDKLILYPERNMRYIDTVCYRQYVKSVITENPFIISSYDWEKVWIMEDGEWRNPNRQTYGASVNMIACSILNTPHTIPLMIINGQKEIDEYKEKVKNNNFSKNYNKNT